MPMPRVARPLRSLNPAFFVLMALTTNIASAQTQRLPPVADPHASKLLSRAESDLARVINAGDAFFDLHQGTPCSLDYQTMTRAIVGPRAHSNMASYLSTLPQPESSRLVVLSGSCPQAGLFNGPVEYITEIKLRSEHDNIVVTVEEKKRANGLFINGNPIGEHLSSSWTNTSSFHRLSSGELISMLGGQATPPHYTIHYQNLDSDSAPISPAVSFVWSGSQPIPSMTIVKRTIDANRDVTDHYNGDKLSSRSRNKNHQPHGWLENFDPELIKIGVGKLCYQHGRMIKAIDCPDS